MSWPEHLGHAFTIPVHPGRAVLAQNAHRGARQVPRDKLADLFQYGTYEETPYQPNIYRVTLDGWYAVLDLVPRRWAVKRRTTWRGPCALVKDIGRDISAQPEKKGSAR